MDYESDGEDERNEFNTSEIDWGEEQDLSWSEEEENNYNSWTGGADSEFSTGEAYERDEEHWDDETESESAFYEEEDLEDTSSQIGLEEETDALNEEDSESEFYMEENREEIDSDREEEIKPWCEMPYSDHEDENQEEINYQCSQEIVEEKEVKSEAGRDDFGKGYIEEDEYISEEPRYIQFSGHKQGPEAYLHWEEDMEYWLRSQNIPKEQKLSHALDTLVGEAQTWWLREEAHNAYHNPVINWGNLKQRMYTEFVQRSHNKSYSPKRVMFQTTPKRWISTPKDARSPETRKTSPPALDKKTEPNSTSQAKKEKQKLIPQAVAHMQNPSSKLEPHCKSSNFSKSKEVVCYRCHKKGHFAVKCPTREIKDALPLSLKPSTVIAPYKLDNSSSCIMHLSMPKSFDPGIRTEAEHRRNGEIKITHQYFPKKIEEIEDEQSGGLFPQVSKEASPPKVNKTEDTRSKPDKILSYLPKEEPPDAPHITKSTQSQDCTVSRSKPFQEGEYDVAIKSASKKEHVRDSNQTTNTLSENQPEHTKDIYAFIEAYQPNRCWKVTIALFFPCLGFFPMGLPRKVFNEAILSHQGITEEWNWFKSFPHEDDIQVTSQQTSNEPDGDQRLLIGDVRPNQEELSCKPTCATGFTHQGSLSNWNQAKTNFGLGDMNFLNRRILRLPYLEPCGFGRLQTYQWRPGDFVILLEVSYNTLKCTKTHGIRRILPHLHLPYPEPSLPHLPCLEPNDIIQQRLFSYSLVCILEPYSVNLDVPRHHQFTPKLSRIKANHNLPYLARFAHNGPTASSYSIL